MHECEHLECFVECAEAAGEQRKSVGLLHEVQLARKEIIQIDQFGIAFDCFVGPLLKWQTDVQTKAAFATGTTLGGAHDSVSAAGNHHVVMCNHFPSKIFRHFELWRIGQSPCRTKHGDFPQIPKWREHLRRVAHFFY